MKRPLLHLIFALASLTTTAWAQQPGTLDQSFNGKGIKSVSFLSNIGYDNVTASLLQPDGKLLVALISTQGAPFDTVSYVARFMPDGKEDLSFGVGGKKEMDAKFLFGDTSYFIANSIALQSDGSIVLGGRHRDYSFGFIDYACIVSLKSDGSFNELFANGAARVYFGAQDKTINTIQIHPRTGNIWASGGSTSSTFSNLFICALTRTGQTFGIKNANIDGGIFYGNNFSGGTNYEYATSSVIKDDILYIGATVLTADNKKHLGVMALDLTTGFKSSGFFNNGTAGTGSITIPLPPEVSNVTNNECSTLRFTPDSNSLFIAGSTIDPNDALNVNFMLAKINLKNGGYIDTSFSQDGTNIYRMTGTYQNYLRTLEIEPNGKMMLAGSLTNSLSYWTALKLLPNGNIDASFGTAGRQVYDGNNGNSKIYSFNIIGSHYNKASQKYLLVGHYTNDLFTVDGLVKQINNNGDADNSYGANSEKTFWGMNENSYLKDIAVRNDGKMIVGGRSLKYYNSTQDALKRLNADGSDDPSFELFISTLVPALPNATIMDVEVLANNKIVVAGHYKNPFDQDSTDFFILRLNEDGTVDKSFNGVGYCVRYLSSRNDVLEGMALHTDGSIILYGYLYDQVTQNYELALIRYSPNGIFDTGFGTGGIYVHPDPHGWAIPDDFSKDADVKIRSDGKIIVGSKKYNGSNDDMTVFMLTATGLLDNSFGAGGVFIGDYGTNASQGAISLCIRSDDKILVGGYSRNSLTGNVDNAIVLLNANGTLDPTFGSGGWVIVDKVKAESISYITVNNNKIIAAGYTLGTNSPDHVVAMRFSMTGVLDNTFTGQGYSVLANGLPFGVTLSNNKLYFAGADRDLDGQKVFNGLVVKANLGIGPVVKTTNLVTANYNKILGDEPFLLAPVSNSPAAKIYSISISGVGCVSVDPTTGLVTMACATVDSSPVVIRVVQAVTSGFTADTAYSIVNVAKGIPAITFNPQGDTLTSTIVLITRSNSDGYPQFSVLGGDVNAISLNGNGTAYVNAEGCIDVQVYYPETADYLAAYANTRVCGYIKIIPPGAFDDNVDLAYPVQQPIKIDPLANDEAYTGSIVPSGLDLDPSTEGIQHSYVSPALGKFVADTVSGIVTYTPFEGFVGQGSIDYVVYDSKGTASAAAKIYVNVTTTIDVPALKATEMFTPNDDGLNDAFVIGFVDLTKQNQLKIFDRNGAELFTKNNYNNDWYGELSNGKMAENGVYYYTFTESGKGDKVRELKGAVELRK